VDSGVEGVDSGVEGVDSRPHVATASATAHHHLPTLHLQPVNMQTQRHQGS
jgi:hypothetical protein